MTTERKNETSNFHYYATCGLGWATAPDRDTAIRKLVGSFRSDFTRMVKNLHKEGKPGAYVWSCKVHAPADAAYKINFYVPEGVEYSEVQEHAVTYVTQKEIAYCQDWKQEAKILRERYDDLADAIREHKSYHAPEVRKALREEVEDEKA